jgi:TPR repeat protein
MRSSKPIIVVVVISVLTPLLLVFALASLRQLEKRLEKLPFKPSYHDPIFDKVMPKDYSLADLKASMTKWEPLVTNPTEEDIAIMKADIEEYRARYEANIVCKDKIRDMFQRKYDYRSKYREAIKPLIDELAAQGDMFALATNGLRSGNIYLARREAAQLGEITHMVSEGWFEATGFNRPRNRELGEKYLTEAAERGSYSGYWHLIEYNYRYKYLDKLCFAAKGAYQRFGLEVFLFNIQKNSEMMEYIQNNCHVFSDKNYTSEEMKFDYLKDIDTDESRLQQAMILSNTGDYDTAKAMFEKLEVNEDQKIRANAQLCLSRMYHYGKGVDKNEELADIYANKAFNNGHVGAMMYREWDNNIFVQYKIPEQLIITDYDCVYGSCYFGADEEK